MNEKVLKDVDEEMMANTTGNPIEDVVIILRGIMVVLMNINDSLESLKSVTSTQCDVLRDMNGKH